MLSTRVLETSIGPVAVDLLDGHVHEVTVAGEHGPERLSPEAFTAGFERPEEALVAALVRAGVPESEARAAAAGLVGDRRVRGPVPARSLTLAASSLAPSFFLLAVFGLGFIGLGALIWYFLTSI